MVLAIFLSGCTIGAEVKPTLGTTTSAEQVQRIFWQDVKDGKWLTVQSLLVDTVTWRNGNQVLTRDQIVPYLQQLHVKDFLISNLMVKGNQDDMTVLYDLQMTTGNSAQQLVNLHAVAVWQQVPLPPDKSSKKAKKQFDKASPYLLTVEDLNPDKASN
jgi:hypothetical protein